MCICKIFFVQAASILKTKLFQKSASCTWKWRNAGIKKAHQTLKIANQAPQGRPTIPYGRSMWLHHPVGAYM